MKSPKKSLLPSQDESRRTNVLMEQMLSKFDVFGEVQSDLRDRVGRIETDLHTVKEDVAVLKLVVRSHSEDLHAIKSDVATIKSDVATLKSDVGDIKEDLKGYNHRLEGVETKLAS